MKAKTKDNKKLKVNMTVELLIGDLNRNLLDNPFDAGHDFLHHQEVYNNCVYIVHNEKMDVDMNALSLAAWWHDYERNNEEENRRILREFGRNRNVDSELIDKVIGIISSHSYGEKQQTVEQKVLFDADKIEYANVRRFRRVMAAVDSNQMSFLVWGKYKKAWQDRIPQVRAQLHFEASKDRFDEYFVGLADFIKSDPRLEELLPIVL